MQHTSAILPRAEGAHIRRTVVELPCREDPLWPEEVFEPREQVRAAQDFRTDAATVCARGSRTVTR
ncbi:MULTISPECIES: hypothetical protein [unclassified Streptomyces]|uniref:hypothetical protein n=1 Tax=unclassified Streptomyces TaxID=2593676 RepID=UPI0022513195|nr:MULTISPECIES: hypothetical protein [unclassified Streptomyces]WSP58835.1 hypothetical protein OG306_34025 [Streptomyces sp. NBC_01241]WSU20651.1 hypothetical protein OG508_06345 [Streptomyces sp. NBC_01108]MCX4790560.1 hypothetical protein [Streptomyces sp. NBC_01221]MCX4793714.1 hypothetical protein [Streptomyces sp. NBC_01242]WSJ35135.1 hypothetical protein OG772_03005 [Streptomyces sp. NBC_01321]